MNLSDNPSVSFSDLMSIVASHFGLNTGSAEREAATTVISIHNTSFLVSNLQSVGFSDVSVKPLTIPDPDRRPAILLTFYFVPSFLLPRSISAFQHHLYPLHFLFDYLNHLSFLPQILLPLPRHQQLLY